jgi:HEAT repeat protein
MKSLKTALQDSDEYVQVAAAWGLASTGDKDAIEVLDKGLNIRDKDGKPNVRLAIFAGESLLNLPDRDTESKAD